MRKPSSSSEKSPRTLKTGQLAAIASVILMTVVVLSSLSGMFAPPSTKARTLANDAWIVGYVTDGADPIQDAAMLYVLAMGGPGGPLGMAMTDATGFYNLTVSGGVGYQIVGMNGGYYAVAGSASPLNGQESWLNFTMNSIDPLVADVVLTGYVLDGSGNPVPGGGVLGYVNDPANGGEGMPLYGNLTSPNPLTGEYSVNVIPGSVGGGIGALGFVGYGFIDNTTKDPFESGHTYWINLTLSNPPSTDDAVLSGSVTDADSGDPISGAAVSIEVSNPWMGYRYTNLTFTDVAGDYEMNVTNGSARLTVQAAGYCMYMSNNNFDISPGSHVVMDVTLLATNATISGNVTDAGTGLPLAGVQVILTDGADHYAVGTTNASGGYEMAAFVAPSEWIWTQYDGYSSFSSYVTIQPGEHLWMDFEISPLDAWLTGKVTDAILGTPLADAEVRVHTVNGDVSTNTNATGDYNLTLQSGSWSIEANANNYNHFNEPLEVAPGANTYDIALMPMNLPLTTRLYGWVNDSVSDVGIPNADVQAGLASPFEGQTMSNKTDSTGYYEIWVPPMLLQFVAMAQFYAHAEAMVNATGQTEVRVDASLDPDMWSPNITMVQSPTENISTANPSSIDITVQETDLQQMVLVFFMYVNSSDGTSDYMLVQAFGENFNPLNQGMGGLPYSQTGDNYTVSMIWYTSGVGGLLTSGPIRQYFGAFTMQMGPDVYLGLRAMYYNMSLGSSEQGTAWFSNDTGEFMFFSFDSGMMEFAYPSDPTGIIRPIASILRVNDTTNSTMFYNNLEMGDWSVVGLHLFKNGELPSGRYISVFSASDFGGSGSGMMKLVTVDNDPPMANAGPDQTVAPGDTVYFDGTGSTDNVGITNYTWIFDDGATHVELYGPNPDFTFLGEGVYDVTLEVRDGANHISIDFVQITVTAVIPEFTMVILPIVGMVLIIAVTRTRRSRQSE